MIKLKKTLLWLKHYWYFPVVLISHLASLKDVADITVSIDKRDGFAFINQ
jgi:hypothetical protein